MDDWRSKPRTGRAKITEHSNEIIILLAEGKTNRQIYNLLTNKGLDISESQFNRYIKKIFRPHDKKSKSQLFNSEVNEKKCNSAINSDISLPYEWNNIGVFSEKLIIDLENNGYTPGIVREWGLPESQIRQRLIIENARQKGK
ncbi:hypothetical protein WMR20_004190 [Salmonella enterica]